jgi:hypothetical protein
MTITLTVFRAQVDSLLSAVDDELSQLRREWNVKAAVERYSRDNPYEVTADVTGDGGNYYAIASSLSAWSEGYSQIIGIEYPAPTVANDEAPVYLDPEDWSDDYWDASGASPVRYFYLPNHAPAATETIRVRYTSNYQWAASTVTEAVAEDSHGLSVDDYLYKEDLNWLETTNERLATHIVTAVADTDNYTRALLQTTVPQQDFFAVSWLAAGYCAQAIAEKYSRSSDSAIAVDTVDHLRKADQWSMRARELIGLYKEHMGLTDAELGFAAGGIAAGEFVDWDTSPYNRQYLFHGKHTR